jgi:hypothetical protein
MLYREVITVCSKIHLKHVNETELCYRLRSYRAENTVLCICAAVHETQKSESYRRYSHYDLRIFLYNFIFFWWTIWRARLNWNIQRPSRYRAVNALHLGYKNQTFNAVYGQNVTSLQTLLKYV